MSKTLCERHQRHGARVRCGSNEEVLVKAYRVTLLIVDHDGVGDGIKDQIENVRYPNHCLSPKVMAVESAEIGEWHGDHPLNHRDKNVEEFKRLFS